MAVKCGNCRRWHKNQADIDRAHDLRRAEQERDFYRQRAIDEVVAHHKDATRQMAEMDVDLDVRRNLFGERTVRP